MHDKFITSDKSTILKSYYRRFLIFVSSALAALMTAGSVCGMFLSRKLVFFAPLAVLGVLVATIVFNAHFRSIRKKDGVEDAEWRAYFYRQPIQLHVFFITVALLLAMFVVFKCLRYLFAAA